MVQVREIDQIALDAFGKWSNALFASIRTYNEYANFSDYKDAFFLILKKFLDERKVYFEDPNSKFGSGTIWQADTDTIIQYWLDHWPKAADNLGDADLNIYFYKMPAILWVGDDGKLYSS